MRDDGGVKGAVRVVLVDKMAAECPSHAGFRLLVDYCVQVASQTGPLVRQQDRNAWFAVFKCVNMDICPSIQEMKK